MGPADSRRITRVPRYSGCRYASSRYGYGPITLYGRTFQTVLLATKVRQRGPTTPQGPQRGPGRFGLLPGRSPLLGESSLFSSPAGTKMFQFPALAPGKQNAGRLSFRQTGCPIRKPPDQRPYAPTRSLSQLIASFIA